MKQHITVEDLQQLTEEQKQRLREWWNPQLGDLVYDGGKIQTLHVDLDTDWFIYSGYENAIHSKDWNDDFNTPHIANEVKAGCLPLLSIGQMMQLIRDHKEYDVHLNSLLWISEPAGALWYEVKKILSKPPEEVVADDDDE